MSRVSPVTSSKPFDVGSALDEGPWTAWQKGVVLLVALGIILDGFDNQVLGFAVPVLLKEWGVTRQALAPVFALGFVGMVVGTAVGGVTGDRIGRRPALIGSVILFGIATGFTAMSDGLASLALLRTVAGFGLGAAMPNAATLLAEFAPRRKRGLAVTLGIVCIPLGGVGGGLVAAAILPAFGWQSLFLVGGIMPIAIALLLLFLLPESPRFLVTRPARRQELVAMLARLGFEVQPADMLCDQGAGTRERLALSELFVRDYRRDTAALWIAFFACLLTTYVVFSWAPTLLSQSGFDISMSSLGLATFNIGGVAGALLAAVLMPVYGSRKVMLVMAAGGVSATLGLTLSFGVDRSGLLILLALAGAFINAVQTSLYALGAQMYPTRLRASGVGAAAGFGRIGAIVSSFVGAAILAVGWEFYFAILAVGMAVTFCALTLISRHIKAEI